MLNMFAISTYHLSLIVFEIKDEKYFDLENLMGNQIYCDMNNITMVTSNRRCRDGI
jgi:hypothetical protein